MTAISRFNADVFPEEAEAIREEIDDLAMGNAIIEGCKAIEFYVYHETDLNPVATGETLTAV